MYFGLSAYATADFSCIDANTEVRRIRRNTDNRRRKARKNRKARRKRGGLSVY